MSLRPSQGSPVSCWSRSSTPSFRLICVPYAGSGVSVYHKWAESLPAGVQVCALQLPGRDMRIGVPPFTRVSALVETFADALDPYLDLPYAIFGHSMGGLIGFELTRTFRARGKRMPLHFFVSACRAPGTNRRGWPIHHLSDDGLVRELRLRYKSIPDAIFSDKELLGLFLPILRADMEMVETHVLPTGEILGIPITAFAGADDREVPKEDLEPWRDQTRDGFELHALEGEHFFINSAREEVLRIVARNLAPLVPLVPLGHTGVR